jgi:hypothetical protein
MTQRVNGDLFVEGTITTGGVTTASIGSASMANFAAASTQLSGGEEFLVGFTSVAYPGDGADGNKVYVITLGLQTLRSSTNNSDVIKVYSGPNGDNTDTLVGNMSYANMFTRNPGTCHYSVLVKPSAGDAVSVSATKAADHLDILGSGGSDPNKSALIIREYDADAYVSGAVSS